MDTAAAVGTGRFSATVDAFTRNGIMAVFGALTAVGEHAFRALLGRLDISGTDGETGDGGRTILATPRLGLVHTAQPLAGECGVRSEIQIEPSS
jgi:hypothetical protein